MVFTPVDELDAGGTLAAAEQVVRERRQADVADLRLICHWADLHASDPRRREGRRAWCGEDRLVEIGGDGTPLVQELCLGELATARRVHPLSLRAAMADALDLRHRLPLTERVVEELECEVWVARKIAVISRGLDRSQVAIVDEADAIAGDSPARVLELARAKVIEADPAAYAARLDAELRKRFVSLSRTSEHGIRDVIARVGADAAVWVDALVDQVADALAARRDLVPDLPDDVGHDELRAVAFGWLAHPEDVLGLLDDAPDPVSGPGRQRPTVVVYVHLHQAALESQGAGVARVEGIGPMILEQVRRLVGHARVELKPVIDLNTGTRSSAYEHPESVKERTHLRTIGEVFPYATRVSRRVDMDHPKEWDPHGPPGQTGDHNAAPLGRTQHRAKTHLDYRLVQLGPGDYLWRTPNGLRRRVDASGTHVVDELAAWQLEHPGALDRALDTIR